jgi:hypothetical protein
MPSDAPLNKRRTLYDLDQHFKSFLEATSLDAVATKKISCPSRKSRIRHSVSRRTHKRMKRRAVNHNRSFRQYLWVFFRKPKRVARFGQWKISRKVQF